MSGVFKRLVRQSGIYALGNMVVKASGLLLAPLYLNPAYLSIPAFGYFALLTVTAQLGIFVLGLGLGMGMMRFMTNPAYADDREALPFTTLVTTFGVAVVAGAALWALAPGIAELLLDDAGRAGLVRLMAVYVAFKVVGSVPMTLMRVQERAGLYVIAVLAEMVVLIGGVYFWLALHGEGLAGIMRALACSAGVSTGVLIVGMLVRVPWRFRAALVGPLVRFGAPLVLASLAGWFLNAGDRYLLKWLATPADIGLYDWAARLGGLINMLFVQSFQLAFNVLGLKALGAGEHGIHRRTFRHYVIWTGWAVLGLSLLTLDGMHLLVAYLGIDPFYLGVDVMVLPLALGFLVYGLYVVMNNVLYASGHTKAIGLNVALAALFNVAMNVALIPVLGGLGAALTTLAAYGVLALLTARVAERRHHIGYPWRVLAVVLGLILGLWLLGLPTLEWPWMARLGARLVLILAYLPMLFVFRLYTPADWAVVREAVQEWVGQKRSRER